jgi:acetyl esterase/lipase
MFNYTLRHSFTALVVWTAVLLIFLAAGACSTPGTPAPEELAAVPLTGLSTATRFPISIAPTRVGAPTPVPTIDPGPYEVQIFPGIRYTSKAQLDIFAPTEPGDWPVVIAFNESLGSPRESLDELARSVASYGAVVFVPSWRSLSTPFVEQAAENAACAIRFARQHAGEYGGVPDRITGTGVGNGVWIVALMGLIGDEFDGDCLVESGSGYLDGVVAISGPYNLVNYWTRIGNPYDPAPREFWEKMSPLFYADKIPPRERVEYHLFVSDDLYYEYLEDTRAFYTALKDAGYEAQLTVLPESYNSLFNYPIPETVQVILDMAWGEEGVWEP